MIMHSFCRGIATALLAAVPIATPILASETGVNRGGSIVGLDAMSYFDVPPAGVYLLNYSGVSDSRRFANNSGGDALPGLNANANVTYNVSRISLFAEADLFGADLMAFEIFPTYVRTKVRVAGRTEEAAGLSDLAIDPFGLAWLSDKQNIGFSTTFVLPTASYDQNDPVNVGTNHVTWIPQLLYTRFLPDGKSDISAHLMYEKPFANDEGQVNQINPRGAEYRSGDIFHAAVAYRRDISPNFSMAVSGIGAVQLEDDRIIGDDAADAVLQGPLGGNRYRRGTVGLSVRYLVGGRMPLSIAYQRDVYARNTTKNDSLTLRLVVPFKMF